MSRTVRPRDKLNFMQDGAAPPTAASPDDPLPVAEAAASPGAARMAVPVSRRGLFQGAAGLVAAGCATATPTSAEAPSRPRAAPAAAANGLPGPFPGRVAEIHHPGCVRAGRIDASAAKAMLSRGLLELTGASDDIHAWQQLVQPGDRVGLKVNCVGHPVSDPEKHAVYTSHEMIRAVVAGLRAAGIAEMLLFDRYRMEFSIARYPELAAELGIAWDVSSVSWDESQIDMEGYSKGDPAAEARNQAARSDGSPGVSGYDPDQFVAIDFVHPVHDPADPRTRRSHLAKIVTQKVDKIINLCLLKDHAAAGITGALKNLSHGLVDNVCRSHSKPRLNQTATFIPAVLSHPIIRRKVVLNVMEAFFGLYHGGPWASPYAFEPKRLLLSTDPVAMDRVATGIIDERRTQAGLPPLVDAGRMNGQAQGEHHLFRGTTHVELCGAAGLGVYHTSLEELRSWIGHDPGTVGRAGQVIEVVRANLGA